MIDHSGTRSVACTGARKRDRWPRPRSRAKLMTMREETVLTAWIERNMARRLNMRRQVAWWCQRTLGGTTLCFLLPPQDFPLPRTTYPSHVPCSLVINLQQRPRGASKHGGKVAQAEEQHDGEDPAGHRAKPNGQHHDLWRVDRGRGHLLDHVACCVEGGQAERGLEETEDEGEAVRPLCVGHERQRVRVRGARSVVVPLTPVSFVNSAKTALAG